MLRYSRSGSRKNDNTHHTEEIKLTQAWIKYFVIENGFCPWAAGVFASSKINYILCDKVGDDTTAAIVAEAAALAGPCDKTTSMIILPSLTSFQDFLAYFEEMEELFAAMNISDAVQIATFHPDYIFAGSKNDDPENFTNRSPFPTLHLLRVGDVTAAVDSMDGNTDVIWERNVAHLQRLGLSKVRKRFVSALRMQPKPAND